MDIKDIIAQVLQTAPQIRVMAKDAGTACAMPGCDAITLGARCESCSRHVCVKHAYWRIAVVPPSMHAHCPYCVLTLNPELFSDDDGEDGEDGEDGVDR